MNNYQSVKYALVFALFISSVNTGMIQDFFSGFTANIQTPLDQPSPTLYHHRQNGTNSSKSHVIGESLARGYDSGYYEPHYTTHHGYYHQHSNNMDLYGLLAGLSFASLIGAAIIYLATRNATAGRRRRSLADDEDSFSHITDAIDDPEWDRPKVQPFKLY